MVSLTEQPLILRFIGIVVFGFALVAFVAPPFSGLDTLPALGVVILSLGLILGDILLIGAGGLIGLIGCIITFTVGAVLITAIKSIFN